MANEVALRLRRLHAGEPWYDVLDPIGDIVAAGCLAHDLGNPPFGHSGEKAISTFFSEGDGRELEQQLTRNSGTILCTSMAMPMPSDCSHINSTVAAPVVLP